MKEALLLLVAPVVCVAPTGQEAPEIDPRIWCIHQGRDGDMWFGSNGSGVYRYDGQRVTRYAEADGLDGLQVRAIEEDREGNVFVSTTRGVARFDGERFAALEVEPAPEGGGWELDPDDVWIVCQPGRGGPCRFDGEKLYRLELPESPAEAAFRAAQPDAPFSPAGVYTIHEDRRGHLWFGTASAGLCRFDGESLSWMYEGELTTTPGGGAFGIRSIHEDRAGDFWICNTRQRFEIALDAEVEDGFRLLRYRAKPGLPRAEADADENFTFYSSMVEDAEGALWMACGSDGVWRYDGREVTRYPLAAGAYALSIFRDRDGGLWTATLEHGVQRLEGPAFVPFRPGR